MRDKLLTSEALRPFLQKSDARAWRRLAFNGEPR